MYRVSPGGAVEEFCRGFGRPQGLAFSSEGFLYIIDAIAGANALYRVRPERPDDRECVLSGGSLLGIAFDPRCRSAGTAPVEGLAPRPAHRTCGTLQPPAALEAT